MMMRVLVQISTVEYYNVEAEDAEDARKKAIALAQEEFSHVAESYKAGQVTVVKDGSRVVVS